ncbi:MAG: alpha/beta hydrolase [Dehalococcoidia bacterium]|jgi:3-oxoadipate enol-lactonase
MPEIAASIQINYEEKGEGFPLVLLHGLSDDLNLWTSLLPQFSTHYRTIAIDMRGHGHSGKPDILYSIHQFSEDLFEFLDQMSISRAHLLGLSMGAAVVQQFALDHPDKAASVILLSAFDHIDPHLRENLLRLRNSLVADGLPAFFDEAVKLVVTPDFIATNAAAIADSKKYTVGINSPAALIRAVDGCLAFDVHDRVSHISAPVLILSGREDVFTPSNLAAELHLAIPGSTWITMDSVGHNLITPENIPPLARTVLDFLAAHSIPGK